MTTSRADASNAPRARGRGRTALLIIDMINTFEFEGGSALAKQASRAVPQIVRLRTRFRVRKMPTIFCNDNFGRWRSDFRQVYERCVGEGSRGKAIALQLRPAPTDYFVLKPKHSAFFSTPLELLLRSMNVRRLILTGIAGDGCVLSTAIDAHIRNYDVTVVSDATASERHASNERAMMHLREAVKGVGVVLASSAIRTL